VLGLFFADGNVADSPSHASINIELKDVDYLRRIAAVIDLALPVYLYECKDGRTSAKFYVSRRSIVDDCIALGLVPRKTASVQFPPTLPRELHADFVRGYFDGDGCVFLGEGRTASRSRISIR
jgi:hypothetical protein